MGSLLEPLLPLVKFKVQQLLRLESSSCLLPNGIPVSCHVPPVTCLLPSTAPASCQVFLLPPAKSCFCLLSRTLPPLAECPSFLISRVTSVMSSSCLQSRTLPLRASVSPVSGQASLPLLASVPPVFGQASLLLLASVPPVFGQASLLI
jgi:hypothetical protein